MGVDPIPYDRVVNAHLAQCLNSVLNVKALVGAFNQEKALVGAFSVIVQPINRFAELFLCRVCGDNCFVFVLLNAVSEMSHIDVDISHQSSNIGNLRLSHYCLIVPLRQLFTIFVLH